MVSSHLMMASYLAEYFYCEWPKPIAAGGWSGPGHTLQAACHSHGPGTLPPLTCGSWAPMPSGGRCCGLQPKVLTAPHAGYSMVLTVSYIGLFTVPRIAKCPAPLGWVELEPNPATR